jgi:hypothetical protein
MTKGILIFAYNNQEIDYVKMATFSAKQATKFLNLPVSLVTDSKELSKDTLDTFENIIVLSDESSQSKRFYDGGDDFKLLQWKNYTRASAYDITPYDETLVIDSDFAINSGFLKYCWDQNNDFLIYDKCFDLCKNRQTTEFDFISDLSIKFYWATVFFFRKNEKTQTFFRLLDKVKQDWEYYSKVFYLPTRKFRNDFAFSIAIHLMNGCVEGDFATPIANKLWFVNDRDLLLEYDNTKIRFLNLDNDKKYIPVSIVDKDVHIMNKFSLMRVINV